MLIVPEEDRDTFNEKEFTDKGVEIFYGKTLPGNPKPHYYKYYLWTEDNNLIGDLEKKNRHELPKQIQEVKVEEPDENLNYPEDLSEIEKEIPFLDKTYWEQIIGMVRTDIISNKLPYHPYLASSHLKELNLVFLFSQSLVHSCHY